MKQEDKDLLLKDLCARIPYGVKVQSAFYYCDGSIWKHEDEILTIGLLAYPIERYKPYLFPLSSMTEEQKEELKQILDKVGWTSFDSRNEVFYDMGGESKVYLSTVLRAIEFFNRNHFDYNGLIERELAIDCTNLNVYVQKFV